ncbi:MAG: protocatechuate 3,4-dioxygenase [Myxococcota bacterium]
MTRANHLPHGERDRPRQSAPAIARRTALQWLGASSLTLLAPAAFAETLQRTPRQAKGPYYPDRLPLDTDNDLIVISDSLTPAVGQILHLDGTVRDRRGNPLRNAVVEIWQCDSRGYYIHSDDRRPGKSDDNFQGYGRFETDSAGAYRFRTIRPVPYGRGGRPPHIHFQITAKGHKRLVTQMYAPRDPNNPRDPVLRAASRSATRRRLTPAMRPVPESTIGELQTTFDLVL